jgi:hypothetical protein
MDTLSKNDKKIINIVFNIKNQMIEESKNKDTLIKLNDIIITQKNKQLLIKDSLISIRDNQLGQTTKQIITLSKENKKLHLYKNILIGIIPIVIIETLIIILK